MAAKPQDLLQDILKLAREAGAGILEYYGHSVDALKISKKHDNTFLTEADLCAHNIIYSGLQLLTPDVPVISEEGYIEHFSFRKSWSRCWLSDPLDGTRGFIDQRDEFTVNIALIEDGKPVLGVMYLPVKKTSYYAVSGEGAFKQVDEQEPQPINTRQMNWESYQVLLGFYLRLPILLELFENKDECEIIRVNSSYKFGLIAEGAGDLYPRFGETSEWDTAAGQCILEEAGGCVLDLEGEPLQYNRKESLINPPFVAMGDVTQKDHVIKLIKSQRRTT